jgi:long-chain fatty acid transport protein
VASAVSVASRSEAQTADVAFGGWSWRPREVGARPSGLGGAFVAVADDARAAVTNPAGVALVPNVEFGLGVGERWGSVAATLRGRTVPVSGVPADAAGQPRPCPPGPQPRPWALAFFAQQSLRHDSRLEVVAGPGLVQEGVLAADREQVGVAVARGLTHWLNLGLSLNWRHLRMEGSTRLRDAAGTESHRVTLEGDANKARAVLGALATFGPPRSPTAFRVGVALERDLSAWTIGRREVDVATGTVAPTARVRIEEPPILSGGVAWRLSDTWLLSGQLDYIWYSDVVGSMRHNEVADADAFELADGWEPRFGVEYTRPSPIGGYLKVRAGFRRETAGRLGYVGTDLARAQAFPDVGAAFRGSAGLSLLAEFYARAARFDLDLSQVVVATTSSLSAAGTRRFSFNVTVRL